VSPRKIAILSSAAALGVLGWRACSSPPEPALPPPHAPQVQASTVPAEGEAPAVAAEPDAEPVPDRRPPPEDAPIDVSKKYGSHGPPPPATFDSPAAPPQGSAPPSNP
jgi:hypothetical protein